MGKTVWIVGAGFSKSLGGPLLPQLFTQASELTVRKSFPGHEHLYDQITAHWVRVLYAENVSDKDGRGGRWRDAEEYLDYLDTAQAADGTARKVITELLTRFVGDANATPEAIKRFAFRSRQILAAECSAFVVDADIDTEKWQPYRRWATTVARGDVVITFNYDLVVERLGKNPKLHPGNKFNVLLPPANSFPPDHVTVLKLHGSVNWRRTETDVTAVEDDYFALGCKEEEMTIATPGPSKFSNSAGGPLESLWVAAKSALRTADAIVFVGYRFPPTDSAARRNLIEAIAANDQPHLHLHTVLGENTNNADTMRLKAMLEQAMRRKGRRLTGTYITPLDDARPYSMTNWPLRAEDFLDLYQPHQL
jgi:SIR2-like protein